MICRLEDLDCLRPGREIYGHVLAEEIRTRVVRRVQPMRAVSHLLGGHLAMSDHKSRFRATELFLALWEGSY